MLVIDQSEYIEDRPVPGPFPAFPMTKREKPWERGCVGHWILEIEYIHVMSLYYANYTIRNKTIKS